MSASKEIQEDLDELCKDLESCDKVLTANNYFIKVKLPYRKGKKVIFGLIIRYKDDDKIYKFHKQYKINKDNTLVGAWVDFLMMAMNDITTISLQEK